MNYFIIMFRFIHFGSIKSKQHQLQKLIFNKRPLFWRAKAVKSCGKWFLQFLGCGKSENSPHFFAPHFFWFFRPFGLFSTKKIPTATTTKKYPFLLFFVTFFVRRNSFCCSSTGRLESCGIFPVLQRCIYASWNDFHSYWCFCDFPTSVNVKNNHRKLKFCAQVYGRTFMSAHLW